MVSQGASHCSNCTIGIRQYTEADHARILHWREREGVEPTPQHEGAKATDLKSARATGPHPPPQQAPSLGAPQEGLAIRQRAHSPTLMPYPTSF